MKFKGNGVIWDAENNRVLCRFKDGELETEDSSVIDFLKENDFEFAESEDETSISKMKMADLKVLCDEKGIEYDAKAKKEDLIKLLEGAE